MNRGTLKRIRRCLKSRSGASAVEFALVVPVLFLFLAGITQFGVTFFQWLELEHSAREGVRWASLRDVPTAEIKQRTIDAAPGLQPPLLDADVAITDTTGNITGVPDGPVDFPCEPLDCAGEPVTLTVSYDSPVFTQLMRDIFGIGADPTIPLTSSATQRIE